MVAAWEARCAEEAPLTQTCRAGRLPLTDLGIQRAEAAVAMDLERAHTEFVGQSEGLAAVGFGMKCS